MPACDQPPQELLNTALLPCFSIVSRMALAVRPSATSQLYLHELLLAAQLGLAIALQALQTGFAHMGAEIRVLS